jgi:hypothetical protein
MFNTLLLRKADIALGEAHKTYAQIARRANVSQPVGIALTPKSPPTSHASRTHKRGVSRSSRTLGAGCGGRFGGALTNGVDADGEVVWS